MGLFKARGVRGSDSEHGEQRRESFRMAVVVKGEIFGAADREHIRPTPCEILNLSGGGARLKTEAPYGRDVVLHLRIKFPDDPEPALLPFQVVYSRFFKQNYYPYGYYHHGVRFLDPPRKDAQRVMQYLFKMERRYRDSL